MTAGAARDPHGQAYWDVRYASRERIWSGEPNRQLVAEAASLPPGRALDAGSGDSRRPWHPAAVSEIAQPLDRDVWDVEVAEARPRSGTHPDGRAVTLHDAVVRARRRR